MSDILDPIVMGILFMFFVMGCVVAYWVFDLMPDFGQTDLKTSMVGFYDALNYFGGFVVVAMILATVGSAFLLRSNPVFFIIAVILIFVQFLVFPPIVNVLNSVVVGFTAGAEKFSLLIWLMGMSPITSLAGGLLAAVVGMKAE